MDDMTKISLEHSGGALQRSLREILKQTPDWSFVIASFVTTTLATSFCLGSFVFLLWYRKNTIISLSQPRFLGTAFLASAVVAGSGYFLLAAHLGGTRPNATPLKLKVSCCLSVWGFVLGHNIVYMALFGKLWRIQKVCQTRRHQAITVRQTIWPLRLMVAINLCILIAWVLVDPPVYVELERGDGSVGTCDIVQPAFVIPIQILLIISACLGLWMAYKTKHLPGDLNDGGRIFNVYVGNIFALAVAGPVYWIGYSLQNPTMVNAGFSLAFSLTSITSVAPLAIPKMYYVWYEKKHNKLPEGVGSIGHGTVHVSTGNTGNRRSSFAVAPASVIRQAVPTGSEDREETEPPSNEVSREDDPTLPNQDAQAKEQEP